MSNLLPCPFISIRNAATATLPVGMARLKKKTVTQVKRRKLCSSPNFRMRVIWLPRPWRTEKIPKIWVRIVNNCSRLVATILIVLYTMTYPGKE